MKKLERLVEIMGYTGMSVIVVSCVGFVGYFFAEIAKAFLQQGCL